MSSNDALSDRQMLEQIIKEVRKGECTTMAAFSASVALVGGSLFGEYKLNYDIFSWEFFLLFLIGVTGTIFSLRQRAKNDQTK